MTKMKARPWCYHWFVSQELALQAGWRWGFAYTYVLQGQKLLDEAEMNGVCTERLLTIDQDTGEIKLREVERSFCKCCCTNDNATQTRIGSCCSQRKTSLTATNSFTPKRTWQNGETSSEAKCGARINPSAPHHYEQPSSAPHHYEQPSSAPHHYE